MFTGGSLVQIVDASCKMFRYVKPTSVSIPNISKVQLDSGFTFLWVVKAYLFFGTALKETRPAKPHINQKLVSFKFHETRVRNLMVQSQKISLT